MDENLMLAIFYGIWGFVATIAAIHYYKLLQEKAIVMKTLEKDE